ncbi:MAG: hypothetical protein QXL46_04435 [Nitrososphaerales archaeon]
MEFQEEVEALSNISIMLLRKLESEPEYVKRYMKEVCKSVQKEGWLEKEGDKPWVKTFERKNYTLKIGFIHARRGEHITGADLAFELKDKKVVFIQSKRVSSNGRIYFNRFQLQKLMELEWQIYVFPLYSTVNFQEWIEIVHHFFHRLRNKYETPFLNPILPFLLSFYPFRAAFYHLIMEHNKIDERIFHTSEICFSLAGNKSVHQNEFLNHGLKVDEFQKMFWECKVGGPDIREERKRDVLYLYSMHTNRLIIWLNIEER